MEAKEIINQCYKTDSEYNVLKRVNGDTFSIAIACPINLKIVYKKETNNFNGMEVKIENVVDENCKRAVIVAKAGCGKTTFCRQFINLSQNSKDFPFNEQIIHIPLRRLKNYLKQKKPYNLINAFENEFFSQKSNGKKLAEELFLDYEQNKYKYLFLLDGLDEVDQDIVRNESHSMHKCLMDLLKSSAEHYLIVTTRPYISLKDYNFSMKLEIKELDHFDVSEYINRFVQEDLRQEIHIYTKISTVANSLMCTPILLDIICICFEDHLFIKKDDGKDFELKITNLFKIVIEELWRKYLNKKEIDCSEEHMSSKSLNSKMKNDIEFLEKLAFEQNKKNLIQFSREDFTLENPNLIKSFIFQSELVGKDKHVYSFIHYYFQDYFAAKYIIRNFEKQEIIDFIRENKYELRFQHVWPFVAGMADIKCANKLFDLLEQHPRDLCGGNVHQRLILSCLNETEKPSTKDTYSYREERLSEEFVKHLKFIYDTKGYVPNEFLGTLPCKVLDKLLDWDNFKDPGFNEFTIYVLRKRVSLPFSYLLKLFEIYEKSYEIQNEKNLEPCKSLIEYQRKIPNSVFVKINENLLQNPEMWLELLERADYIPEETLNVIWGFIFKKIKAAHELNLKIENGTTDENKAALDNYSIYLKGIISKSMKVFNNFASIPELFKEEISKNIDNFTIYIDIQKILKKLDKDSDLKKEDLESDSDVELAEILSYRCNDKRVTLDRIFKAFETKNEIAKNKILRRYRFHSYLQENHIKILKQLIKSSEILNENRIWAILWLWNQEKFPCDSMILEEVNNLFLYKGANSFLFNTHFYLVEECQKTLKLEFYKMSEEQRGRILKEMYKFLANHDCNDEVYAEWVNFLTNVLTLEDLQQSILYLFEHKIPMKYYHVHRWLCYKVPIDFVGKLIAIFNNDFDILNTMTNSDQVFYELCDIMESNLKKFSTVSDSNLNLIERILRENYKMSYNVILRLLQFSPEILGKTHFTSHCENPSFDFLGWFLDYLQQMKEDEDEQKLSKMFTNVMFPLTILNELFGWTREDFIKINATLNIKTEPNFLDPRENLLKKCQKMFPNYHNDLSIYLRFHSLHERNAYLQKAIHSCSNYKLQFGENSFLVFKNAILGFLKIEIASNSKFCIDDFKSLLEKELKNFELVHLDLSKNKLTDCDVFNIVPLIKKNTKLESLILSHNEITYTGFLFLLHEIKSKIISLKCLFLDFNHIMLRHEDINCIPEGISDILERIDLSMNFIPKEKLEELTDTSFSIYKSYYNDIHASIFPMSQEDWQNNHEGSIALCYKSKIIPGHVFILMDQINKKFGQRTITKAELTVNSNGEANIRETKITNPKDFLFYIENFKNKKCYCRYALLTNEKFDKLFNKIKDLRSSQNFRDYNLLPYFFGNNCVTIMVEILKEIDIPTSFVISPKRITFSYSTYKYLLVAFVILIISLVVNYFL